MDMIPNTPTPPAISAMTKNIDNNFTDILKFLNHFIYISS